MNTTTAYDEAATAAEAASEAAKVTPSKEAFQKSAQMHLAAARLAKRVGKADEMNAHNAEGEASLKVAKRLESGMTGEEVTEALVKLDAGGPGSGRHAVLARAAEEASKKANVASNKANLSGDKKDHISAAAAHSIAWKKNVSASMTGDEQYRNMANNHYELAVEHSKKGTGLEASLSDPDATSTAALQATATARMVANTELQAGIVAGGYSYNDFQANVRDAVAGNAVLTTCPQGADGKMCSPCGGPWVADIICPKHEEGETWKAVVQGADGKLYLVNFKVGKDGIAIEGDPKQVEKVTDYDYVMQPTAPSKVAGTDATPSTSLDASRATDAAKNRYATAATDAQAASNGIKPAHKKAMHLHKIASECAGMCGDDTSKAMHDGKAAKHAAALEAEDAMDDGDMMAGNAAGGGALEAGTIILPGLPKTASSMSGDLTKLAVDKGKAANSFPSKVNHQAASEAHAMAATHYPKDSFMNISHTNAASEFATKASAMQSEDATATAALEAGGPGSGPKHKLPSVDEVKDAYLKTGQALTEPSAANHEAAAVAHDKCSRGFASVPGNETQAKSHAKLVLTHTAASEGKEAKF